MSISAKDVMTLRQKTGLGMMDCKQALTETNGDMDAAIELLRTRLKGKMDARTDRAAAQGLLSVKVAPDASAVAIIEINTETDFTARNDATRAAAAKIAEIAFAAPAGQVAATAEITALIDELRITTGENISYRRGLKVAAPYVAAYLHHDEQKAAVVAFSGPVEKDAALGVAQHVLAHVPTPLAPDESGIAPDLLTRARSDAEAEAAESGKPANIIEKMVEGKVRKFIAENTLVNQIYVKDPEGKKTVGSILPSGVKVLAFDRWLVGV